MAHSRMLYVVYAFIAFELVNTFLFILPALKETTAAGRQRRLIRAGIFNAMLIAGFVACAILLK